MILLIANNDDGIVMYYYNDKMELMVYIDAHGVIVHHKSCYDTMKEFREDPREKLDERTVLYDEGWD